MADRVRAAVVAQNTRDCDDQRGDQDDEPENDDHESSETKVVGEKHRERPPGCEALGRPGALARCWNAAGGSPGAGAPPVAVSGARTGRADWTIGR